MLIHFYLLHTLFKRINRAKVQKFCKTKKKIRHIFNSLHADYDTVVSSPPIDQEKSLKLFIKILDFWIQILYICGENPY